MSSPCSLSNNFPLIPPHSSSTRLASITTVPGSSLTSVQTFRTVRSRSVFQCCWFGSMQQGKSERRPRLSCQKYRRRKWNWFLRKPLWRTLKLQPSSETIQVLKTYNFSTFVLFRRPFFPSTYSILMNLDPIRIYIQIDNTASDVLVYTVLYCKYR